MSFVKTDEKRRLIPRWRSVLATIRNGELDPVQTRPDALGEAVKGDYFGEKLEDWRENRSPIFASELVAAAVVESREFEVRDAATYLLEREGETSQIARRLAHRVLDESTQQREATDNVGPALDASDRNLLRAHPIRDAVATLRKRLVDYPRNSLGWVDLARYYTILGEDKQAKRAITAAITISPDSRIVLRSAVRFWVHQDDPDEAHRLLRRSARTPRDPWLLSAEIAVASVAGRTSKLVKDGRALLTAGRFSARQLSELSGSIASLELDAGKMRQARKLFASSLEDPNDNTVAQAEWASRRAPEIHVDSALLDVPFSFEARAWESYVGQRWQSALQESWNWFNDEPFSSRPVALGTHIAAVALENYAEAERLARTWLSVNPDDQLVLNNLAFSLASAGKIREAEEVLALRNLEKSDEQTEVAWTATEGLIRFRQGQHEAGRSLYEAALAMAKRMKHSALENLAVAYWAREELIAGGPRGLALYELFRQVEEPDGEEAVSIRLLKRQLSKLLHERSS